jgi:hypothetical protein
LAAGTCLDALRRNARSLFTWRILPTSADGSGRSDLCGAWCAAIPQLRCLRRLNASAHEADRPRFPRPFEAIHAGQAWKERAAEREDSLGSAAGLGPNREMGSSGAGGLVRRVLTGRKYSYERLPGSAPAVHAVAARAHRNACQPWHGRASKTDPGQALIGSWIHRTSSDNGRAGALSGLRASEVRVKRSSITRRLFLSELMEYWRCTILLRLSSNRVSVVELESPCFLSPVLVEMDRLCKINVIPSNAS